MAAAEVADRVRCETIGYKVILTKQQHIQVILGETFVAPVGRFEKLRAGTPHHERDKQSSA
jgi:hypothetical protein